MTFEVSVNSKKKAKLLISQVISILAFLGIFWFIDVELFGDKIKSEGLYPLFFFFLSYFFFAFIFAIYAKKRPRINVNGGTITFYPLFKPKKVFRLPEITSRAVKHKNFMGNTISEYSDTNQSSRFFTPYKVYTYYSEDKKLITIRSSEMDNAEKFDKLVQDSLDGKPIPLETYYTEEEIKPISRKPAILSILLIGCLILSFLFFSNVEKRLGDFLAGTSWIAANDGSNWVFNKNGSTYWYQDDNVTNDNYYAGTYEIHSHRNDLEKYLSKSSSKAEAKQMLKEFQVTMGMPEENQGDIIVFSVTNHSFMYNGNEQLKEPATISYFAVLSDDETKLSIYNMSTGTIYNFSKNE